VFITEAPGDATERTWHPPLGTRILLAFCLGAVVALPAGYIALTLWTNQVADSGWIALALGLPAWGFLAGRVLNQSATLTPDTLVIRNIFTTERVPLADVTDVGFHRSKLTVTSKHGTYASERNVIGMTSLGSSYWSGLRSRADEIADEIAGAAGLPALPPRREIVSPNRAWLILVVSAALFAVGVYLGPVGSMQLQHRNLAVREVGAMAYVFGITALGAAIRLVRDHRRKGPRPPRL
jgi:hypothetical protein